MLGGLALILLTAALAIGFAKAFDRPPEYQPDEDEFRAITRANFPLESATRGQRRARAATTAFAVLIVGWIIYQAVA